MMKLQSSGVLESFRSGFIKSGIDKSWHAWAGQSTDDWFCLGLCQESKFAKCRLGYPKGTPTSHPDFY